MRVAGRMLSVVPLLAVVVIGACGSSTEPVTLTPCQGELTVSVSGAGSTPEFSWSPACGATGLNVDDESALPGETSSAWSIHAEDGLFGPTVRYGTAPRGATSLIPTLALKTGHRYRVQVLRAGGEVAILSQGSTTFVR